MHVTRIELEVGTEILGWRGKFGQGKLIYKRKVKKSKVHPYFNPRHLEGSRGIALSMLDLGTRRGGCSASRPCRFTPGKDPVPIVQEAGWAPWLVWTGAKHLASTGLTSLPPSCVDCLKIWEPKPHGTARVCQGL
jgi:hypothetical protein